MAAADKVKSDGTPALIYHAGGRTTAFAATSGTNVGYGTALVDAMGVFASSGGEALLMGPGTFDISGSNYSIIPPAGIVMRGSGMDLTVIVKSDTPSDQLQRVAILNPSSNSIFSDFTVWGTSPTSQQSPVGCYRTATSLSNLAFLNAMLLRLHIIGAVDSFHINVPPGEALAFSATIRDCILDSEFDNISLIAGGSTGTFEIERCRCNAIYPNPTVAYQYPDYVDTIGFVTTAVKAFGNLRVNVRNSVLSVGGANTTNSAVQPRSAGADIRVYGSELSSTGTNALDIEIVAGSASVDSATKYDNTKTSGAVALLNTLNQLAVPTADYSLNGHKLTNVTDPTSAQDAATKAYVDADKSTISAYGSGANYNFPANTTAAAITQGTVSPSITLTAGKWLIRAGLKIASVGIAEDMLVSFKLRRTNNTAADLPNTSEIISYPGATLLDSMSMQWRSKDVVYNAAAGDVVTIFGFQFSVPGSGQMNASQSYIIAIPKLG